MESAVNAGVFEDQQSTPFWHSTGNRDAPPSFTTLSDHHNPHSDRECDNPTRILTGGVVGRAVCIGTSFYSATPRMHR